MIGKKMHEAFNNQINAEMYSSYLYLAMAAWFESTNLRGFARWMRMQAQEEMSHAMKFFDHVVERGGKDHASGVFLQWFINEQVEEEAAADDIVQKLKMIGEHTSSLFMLDRALGERKAGN